MDIKKTTEGTKLIYDLSGELDLVSSPILQKDIDDSIENITDLVFNFKNVTYISSTGIRVLLAAKKTMNKKGNLKLLNVNDTIMDLFKVTGFDSILDIENNNENS